MVVMMVTIYSYGDGYGGDAYDHNDISLTHQIGVCQCIWCHVSY